MRKDLNVVSGMHFDHRELGEWVQLTDEEVFKNKRVVIFSLPGAFTPTCTTQQLPGYEEKYEEFTDKHGIDEVYCISVNDAFVMNAWFDSLDIKKVKPIPDGSGRFTKFVHMLVDKDNLGFGYRSWRYAAVVNDGLVEKVFIEPGIRNNAANDPFDVSDAQNVLNYLGGKDCRTTARYDNVVTASADTDDLGHPPYWPQLNDKPA